MAYHRISSGSVRPPDGVLTDDIPLVNRNAHTASGETEEAFDPYRETGWESFGDRLVNSSTTRHRQDSNARRSSFGPRPPSYRRATTQDIVRTPPSSAPLLDSEVKYPPPPLTDDYSFLPEKTKNSPMAFAGQKDFKPMTLFSTSFEKPDWTQLGLHLLICIFMWPTLYVVTLIARDRTLFWTRVVVSVGTGLVGFLMGTSLIILAQRHSEAAVWATVIHQSQSGQAGVKLSDFAMSSLSSSSAWRASTILLRRFSYPGTMRKARRHYDARPWSLIILFFLLVLFVAALGPFALGRIVNIETRVEHQRSTYHEVSMVGDLSDNDIAQASAQEGAFVDFVQTWTLAPFASGKEQPRTVNFVWEDNQTVYFAEPTYSQLLLGGHGLGTFALNSSSSFQSDLDLLNSSETSKSSQTEDVGSLLRYPQWGIRMYCEKLPDPVQNLVPRSNDSYTYVLVPRNLIKSLISASGSPSYEAVDATFDTSTVLSANDTLPDGVDSKSLFTIARFWDNGVAHSFYSSPLTMGADGAGWASVEIVLVRLGLSYAPSGQFSVKSSQTYADAWGNQTYIGYDAAVCLELFEPWVLEVFNSTVGLPATLRLVDKGGKMRAVQGEKMKGPSLEGVNRMLNSTGKASAYVVAHGNSNNQILKDNGRDFYYVPSPTVVSYTNGSGPEGYTELSSSYFAAARAQADAQNLLPFLAGTGNLVAYAYKDVTLASANLQNTPLAIALAIALALGALAGLCVPTLPCDIPRRNFSLYSWVSAFHGNELVVGPEPGNLERHLGLEEVEKQMGNTRVRYHID